MRVSNATDRNTMQPALRHEDRGAGRTAIFKLLVCFRGIFELVSLIDRNFYRAGPYLLEQILGTGDQILTLGHIVIERRACREQRALRLQDVDVEGFDLTRCTTEADEIA